MIDEEKDAQDYGRWVRTYPFKLTDSRYIIGMKAWLSSRKDLREKLRKIVIDYLNDPEFDTTPLEEFVNPKLKEKL